MRTTMSAASNEVELDLLEWKHLREASKRPTVQAHIQDRIIALEHHLAGGRVPQPLEVKPSPVPEIFKTVSNFAWNQTTELVKLYATFDGVDAIPADAVSVHFDTRSLDLQVKGVPGIPNSRLIVKPLNRAIDPTKSFFRVKRNVVSLTLKKDELKWWTDLKEKVQDKEDVKDPSANLMSLMRNLYEEGDDEMKRTIAKAWTESQEKSGMGGSPDLMANGFGSPNFP